MLEIQARYYRARWLWFPILSKDSNLWVSCLRCCVTIHLEWIACAGQCGQVNHSRTLLLHRHDKEVGLLLIWIFGNCYSSMMASCARASGLILKLTNICFSRRRKMWIIFILLCNSSRMSMWFQLSLNSKWQILIFDQVDLGFSISSHKLELLTRCFKNIRLCIVKQLWKL